MADDEQPSLLDRVEAYIERYRLAKTQFGIMAVRSPGFVNELRKGRKIWPSTRQKVEAFLSQPPPGHNSPRSFKVRAYRKAIVDNQKRELAEKQLRQTDVFERARLWLQQRNVVVFAAWVIEPDRKDLQGKFYMGSRLVTAEEVIERAKERGWVE